MGDVISADTVLRGLARVDVRAAARRLLAACRTHDVDVSVRRRDVELLLATVAANAPAPAVGRPQLHPAQQ